MGPLSSIFLFYPPPPSALGSYNEMIKAFRKEQCLGPRNGVVSSGAELPDKHKAIRSDQTRTVNTSPVKVTNISRGGVTGEAMKKSMAQQRIKGE